MAFDPISFSLALGQDLLLNAVDYSKKKRTKKKQLFDQYATDTDELRQQTKMAASEARLNTMASGVKESTLAVSLQTLLQQKLDTMRKRRDRDVSLL